MGFEALKFAPFHKEQAKDDAIESLQNFMFHVGMLKMPTAADSIPEKDLYYLTWAQVILNRSTIKTNEAVERNLKASLELYGEEARDLLTEFADFVRSAILTHIDNEEYSLGDIEYDFGEPTNISNPITRYAKQWKLEALTA